MDENCYNQVSDMWIWEGCLIMRTDVVVYSNFGQNWTNCLFSFAAENHFSICFPESLFTLLLCVIFGQLAEIDILFYGYFPLVDWKE